MPTARNRTTNSAGDRFPIANGICVCSADRDKRFNPRIIYGNKRPPQTGRYYGRVTLLLRYGTRSTHAKRTFPWQGRRTGVMYRHEIKQARQRLRTSFRNAARHFRVVLPACARWRFRDVFPSRVFVFMRRVTRKCRQPNRSNALSEGRISPSPVNASYKRCRRTFYARGNGRDGKLFSNTTVYGHFGLFGADTTCD